MVKLQELARIHLANIYLDVINNCKLKKDESDPKGTPIVDCDAIDIDTAFREIVTTHEVFNIAKEMGV